ncbi:MAG: LuxR C-terminal-related transcriptional regulator [Chloroflexota bacterium]
MAEKSLKVLTVAAYPTLQYGLRAAVQEDPSLEVVGAITEFSAVPGHIEILEPDVILADVDWHPDDFEDLRRIPDLPPILLLVETAESGADALFYDVRGVLLRDADGPTISAAVRAITRGLVVMDSRIQELARPDLSREPQRLELEIETLSPREIEVLELIARGLTNRGIALELEISEHTVKFHVGSILGKLNAGSRSEALARAMAAGLISV